MHLPLVRFTNIHSFVSEVDFDSWAMPWTIFSTVPSAIAGKSSFLHFCLLVL